MKKVLICFLGLVLMSCYEEVNNDVTIKIDNQSSQDLHLSFSPNVFTHSRVGVTYKYNDVNVKKGEAVLLIVEFRYNRNKTGVHEDAFFAPHLREFEKIIFSKMDTGELIKEVWRDELIIRGNGRTFYSFEITNELLNTQGD